MKPIQSTFGSISGFRVAVVRGHSIMRYADVNTSLRAFELGKLVRKLEANKAGTTMVLRPCPGCGAPLPAMPLVTAPIACRCGIVLRADFDVQALGTRIRYLEHELAQLRMACAGKGIQSPNAGGDF